MIHTNWFQNKTVYRFYRVKMTSRFNENEMLTYLSAIWERFWGKIIGYMKKKMQSSRFPFINHMVNDEFISSLYWKKNYDNWEYSRLISPQFSRRYTHTVVFPCCSDDSYTTNNSLIHRRMFGLTPYTKNWGSVWR